MYKISKRHDLFISVVSSSLSALNTGCPKKRVILVDMAITPLKPSKRKKEKFIITNLMNFDPFQRGGLQLARSYGHVNNEYSFLGRPLDRYKSPRSTIFMTIPQAATASYAVYIATRRPAIFLPYHTNPSQISLSLPNQTILYPMLKIKKICLNN